MALAFNRRTSLRSVIWLSAVALPLLLQAQSDETSHRYAVLVGIENYAHPKLREPGPLQYAVDDVTELAAVLRAAGYDVVLLTDETAAKAEDLKPTRANIEASLRSVLRKSGPSDTVLVAFAGHGLQFAGQKDAYFCPQDARPFADETQTLVSISGIYSELEKSFAGVKVILVDACRNDPDPGRGRGLDADSAPPPPKGVGALFSCSAGQRAFEHDELRHGVFFHYVLEGLRQSDAQGEVTFEGLSLYVRRRVPTRVGELFPGREQLPNLKADLVGVPPVLIADLSPAARTGGSVAAPVIPRSIELMNDGRPLVGSRAGEERDDNGLKLVWCPPGEFTMGSPTTEEDRGVNEGPVPVTLTQGFWIGKYEVTQAQWRQVMGTEPWKGQEDVKEGAAYATTYVSRQDALEFCRRLTDQEGRAGRLPPGWEYTLPTDAQWEYACRAGTTTPYSFGDDESQLGEYAWWGGFRDGNARSERYAHEVGRKRANPWGLHDVHGNVNEWCRDVYVDKLPGGRDPEVTAAGSFGVIRSGGWDGFAMSCRSAGRGAVGPAGRFSSIGFRVVCAR